MRSLLFVPGDSERKLAKVLAAGADVVLVDLEDSVSDARKTEGRALAAEFLQQIRAGGEAGATQIFVRINALQSPHCEKDLLAIIAGRPDGIMLPKSRGGDDVHHLSVFLGTLEDTNAIADGHTKIIALATEFAASVLALPSYAQSSERLCGLAWGAEDLSAEVGASATRRQDGSWTSPYRLTRDLTLFAATAAGVAAIDTVFTDIGDLMGLEAEAGDAARDGFTGKMAVHPDQVAVINAAFTPSADEIERAKAIVAVFARTPDAGVAALDGEMLDQPHLVRAKRLLARTGEATDGDA